MYCGGSRECWFWCWNRSSSSIQVWCWISSVGNYTYIKLSITWLRCSLLSLLRFFESSCSHDSRKVHLSTELDPLILWLAISWLHTIITSQGWHSSVLMQHLKPYTAGGHANQDGALFYHVEPRCGNLPCPSYEEQKEMTCAVCTHWILMDSFGKLTLDSIRADSSIDSIL